MSLNVRRVSGLLSLLALQVAIVGGVMGMERVFTVAFLTFFALPWLTFLFHLNLLADLSPEEKALWRGELWTFNSYRGYIAMWAYLFSPDLSARARGFRPYPHDPQ